MFTCDEVTSPILEIKRLCHSRRARDGSRESSGKKHPDISNGAIALQTLRLRLDIPTIVRHSACPRILMSRGFHFDCRAGLGNEIERRLDLAGWRETAENIADKVFGKSTDVRILFGKIPKRPSVERKCIQKFSYCRYTRHELRSLKFNVQSLKFNV